MAPGPGRLDPIAFPPEEVTGLFLIDSASPATGRPSTMPRAHLVLPTIVLAAATWG